MDTVDTVNTMNTVETKGTDAGLTSGIVVGIDGSKGSSTALQWAMHEAKLRGTDVTAVYAWAYPYAAGVDVVGYVVAADEYEQMHRSTLDTAMREAVPDDAARAAIKTIIVCDSPGAALIKAGEQAQMIVVGARGHGGFLGLILGSVSTQVVHHASTTVVVVR
jgi:nucleotide-binding universal stress UspA family protein